VGRGEGEGEGEEEKADHLSFGSFAWFDLNRDLRMDSLVGWRVDLDAVVASWRRKMSEDQRLLPLFDRSRPCLAVATRESYYSQSGTLPRLWILAERLRRRMLSREKKESRDLRRVDLERNYQQILLTFN